MPANAYEIEFNPQSVIDGYERIRKAQKLMETDSVKGSAAMSKAIDDFSKTVTRATSAADRHSAATDKYIQRQVESNRLAGQSGLERINAQRQIAIQRITAEGDAYGKLNDRLRIINKSYDDLTAKYNAQQGGSESGLLALRGIRDLFEGRTAYGEVQIGKSLMGLSGGAAVIGGIAAALAGLGVAAASAYKSLASYGVEMRNAELRTGFTAKEVTQFGFAARLSGQDISIFERTMRGLTQAVEDQSAQGNKARTWLTRFGVDIRGVREGTVSTAQVFEQLSRGFSQLTNPIERDKAALDLFKRAGIEILPVIENITSATGIVRANGWGVDEASRARFQRYQQNVVMLSMAWDEATRHLKEYLAQALSFAVENRTLNPAGYLGAASVVPLPGMPHATIPSADAAMESWRRQDENRRLAAYLATQRGRGGLEGRIAQEEGAFAELANPYAPGYLGILGDKRPLDEQARDYDRKRAQLDADRAALARVKSRPEAMLALQNREAEARSTSAFDLTDPEQRALAAYRRAQAEESARAAKSALAYPGDKGMAAQAAATANADTYQAYQEYLRKHAEVGGEAVRKAAENQAALGRVIGGYGTYDFAGVGLPPSVQFTDERGILSPKPPVATKEQMEQWRGEAEIRQIRDEQARQEITRVSSHDIQLAELSAAGGGPGAQRSAIEQGIQLRISAAKQLGELERKQAQEDYAATGNKWYLERDNLKADYAQEKQILETRMQGEIQIGELRKKEIQEAQREIEKLLDTLIEHPSKFGKTLTSYLRTEAIHSVTGPVSGLIARSIYGGGSGGGPSGGGGSLVSGGILGRIFGGGGGASGGASGGPAIIQSPAAPVGGNTGVNSSTSVNGGGNAVDYGSNDGLFQQFPGFGGGGSGEAASYGRSSGGGGTRINIGAAGGGGKLGGGLFSGGGWTGGGPIGGSTTPAGSFLGSPNVRGLEMAGGTALLSSGLLGNYRGTGGGVAMAGLGGAGIGLSLGSNPAIMAATGGLINPATGALIGAAAGALAGVGEMLAGVESPREKAIKDVKATYHITISNTMADQIAGIAQSKYGGNVETAVHSPEVRQMLGIYAAGTGQSKSFPMSANTPFGASLTESGGTLYQSPTYQYGNPYTYKSSLPTYGGNSGGTLPAPGGGGGNTYVALNVGSNSAAKFMTGEYVTPDYVQSQNTQAWNSSAGRTDNTLAINDPGTLVS